MALYAILCPGATCPIGDPDPAGMEFLLGRGWASPASLGNPTAQCLAGGLGLSVSVSGWSCGTPHSHDLMCRGWIPNGPCWLWIWSQLRCYWWGMDSHFLPLLSSFSLFLSWLVRSLYFLTSLTFTFACWDTEAPANGESLLTPAVMPGHPAIFRLVNFSGNGERSGPIHRLQPPFRTKPVLWNTFRI